MPTTTFKIKIITFLNNLFYCIECNEYLLFIIRKICIFHIQYNLIHNKCLTLLMFMSYILQLIVMVMLYFWTVCVCHGTNTLSNQTVIPPNVAAKEEGAANRTGVLHVWCKHVLPLICSSICVSSCFH